MLPELLQKGQKGADAVHNRSAPLVNCFGFIDGTVRPIAQPKYFQRTMYNGHKSIHSIKFQSVVLRNSLIANLAGPYEGKNMTVQCFMNRGFYLLYGRLPSITTNHSVFMVTQLTHWGFICQHHSEIELTLEMREFWE